MLSTHRANKISVMFFKLSRFAPGEIAVWVHAGAL